jgi:cob(I)alamin adenosyltransferase
MAEEAPRSRLYTKSGDDGTTALFGGGRVAKDDARVEAYGAVDELNSAIGVASAFIESERVRRELAPIQNDLFDLGAELASETAGEKAAAFGKRFGEGGEQVARLEALTDKLDGALPPLRTFILPSGAKGGALLHLCRTVCRRAERRVVTLSRSEPVNPEVSRYLNRLSDLLFAMARYVNAEAGEAETPWAGS